MKFYIMVTRFLIPAKIIWYYYSYVGFADAHARATRRSREGVAPEVLLKTNSHFL